MKICSPFKVTSDSWAEFATRCFSSLGFIFVSIMNQVITVSRIGALLILNLLPPNDCNTLLNSLLCSSWTLCNFKLFSINFYLLKFLYSDVFITLIVCVLFGFKLYVTDMGSIPFSQFQFHSIIFGQFHIKSINSKFINSNHWLEQVLRVPTLNSLYSK